jgi:ribosome-associated heat shock protein Hsp15
VVTVALDRAVRILKVLGFAERRGSADDARALCTDLDRAPPKPAHPPPAAQRDPGSGRPTKRERRAIAQFISEDEL